MIETLRSQQYVSAWRCFCLATILDKCEGLELFDGSACCVLLSPVEWVILLGHFETEDWIADKDTDSNEGSKLR